jgi:two-component system sensor histidine kinase AlgZ
MHPILAYRGRLGPYLVAWIPLGGLMTGLLAVAGAPWVEGAAIAFPMTLLYGFICLAAWYPCKAASLGVVPFPKVIVTQAMAAGLSAMLWLFLVDTWVVLLEQIPKFARATERFPQLVPVILAAGVVLYALVAALHYLLMAFEEARRAERTALELEVLAREAELRSLRAQIDPHFLFNALNSISALIGSDPAAARQMCLGLAEFLRDSLRVGASKGIPLAEELALAEKYLAVERVRFGPRLRVELEVSADARSCVVPPLLLQPLVENAVRHGVATLVDGGCVRIEARRLGERLLLTVENPFAPDSSTTTGEGVGLTNVRGRLAALYGGDASLEVRRYRASFRVELACPAVPEATP